MDTVCRYFELDENNNNVLTGVWYAWDDPTDRNGDGQAELDAYNECTRDNGFDVRELEDNIVNGIDVPSGSIVRVFEYAWAFDIYNHNHGGCAGGGRYALVIVPVE